MLMARPLSSLPAVNFAFCGEPGEDQPCRGLDEVILVDFGKGAREGRTHFVLGS